MSEQRETTRKGNILVVDDTPENLHLIVDSLTPEGYEVRPVPSGALALSAARLLPPDIILLDINMPEMDGFQVCRALKSDEQLKEIPVIFISARDETFDKVKAFRVGGADYITKPFQLDEVMARVQTHLTNYRLQRERKQMIADLEEALADVKTLSGLLPICAHCKKIRDDQGYWGQIEEYIQEHSNAQFSHGICPACIDQLYPELKNKTPPAET